MTFLYDAGQSAVLLRRKNEVKRLTQSAEKWICMGKLPFPSWGIYFLKSEKVPDDRSFPPPSRYATKLLGKRNQ